MPTLPPPPPPLQQPVVVADHFMPRKSQQSDAPKSSRPSRASPRSTPSKTDTVGATDLISEALSPSIPVRSRKSTGKTVIAADKTISNGTTSTRTTSGKLDSSNAVRGVAKEKEENTTTKVVKSTPQSRGRKRKAAEPRPDEEDTKKNPAAGPGTTPRKKQKKSYAEDAPDSASDTAQPAPPQSTSPPNESSPPPQRQSSTKAAPTKANPKRPRQTAEQKAAAAMPLALRTPSIKMFVGAHVSMAKALENSVTNAPAYRRQCLRPVLKIAAQMGEPTTPRFKSRSLPLRLQNPRL